MTGPGFPTAPVREIARNGSFWLRVGLQVAAELAALEQLAALADMDGLARDLRLGGTLAAPTAPEETTMVRPPVPPFSEETARQKVRAAEDGWNSRDPAKVALAYTPDSRWRNRSEFLTGRPEIEGFLARKWAKELDYRLIKGLWAFGGDRIAVRFVYECRDAAGQWWRSHGNENWRFDADGLMAERHASINDVPIVEADRLFRWPLGPRPADHPGLEALGL